MQHSFKRFLSLVLTFAMVLSCVPAQVFAVETCEHSYEVTVTEPTCTEDGSIDYTCSLCGDSFSEPGAAAQGHDYQEAASEAATCGASGSVTYECTACGDAVTDELPATGEHSYTEGFCAVCGAEDPDAVPAEEPVEEPAEEPAEESVEESAEEVIELPAPEPNAAEEDGGEMTLPETSSAVAQLAATGDTFTTLEDAIAALEGQEERTVFLLADYEVTQTISINSDVLLYNEENADPHTITAAEGVDVLFEVGENGHFLADHVNMVTAGEHIITLTADSTSLLLNTCDISGAAAAAIAVDNGDGADIQLYDCTVSGAVALELNGSNANAFVAGTTSVLTGNSADGVVVINGDGHVVDVLLAKLTNEMDGGVAFTLNGNSTMKASNFNGTDYNPTTDPMPCAGVAIRYDINYLNDLQTAFDLAAEAAYDDQYPDKTLDIDVLSGLEIADRITVKPAAHPIRLTTAGDLSLNIVDGGVVHIEEGGQLLLNGALAFGDGCWLENHGDIEIQDIGWLHLQSGSEMVNQGTVTNNGGEFINDSFINDFVGITGAITGGDGVCRKYDNDLQLKLFEAMDAQTGYTLAEDYTLNGDMSVRLGEETFILDNATLTVPADCILYIHSKVQLVGDSRIIVEAGGKLIIDEVLHVGTGTVHICEGAELEDNVGIWGISFDGDTADYVNAFWLNNDGEGLYNTISEFNNFPMDSLQMEPGSERQVILYHNHWNGTYWERTPIAPDEMAYDGAYLEVEAISSDEIRADQENVHAFARLRVPENVSWDSQTRINDVFPVYIQRDPNWGFYSDKVASNDTWLRDVRFGPDMENSFFLIVTNDDMTLKRVETSVWAGPDELGGAVVCMKYDNNIWKFQIDEEVAADMSRNLWLNVRATLVDPDGNEHYWDRGINCEPWVWNTGKPDATFDINGLEYRYYADTNRYMYWDPETESDWDTDRLPDGVSYDLETNTMTLNNADLDSLGISYGYWDDYWQENFYCLPPNTAFRIELVGDNYIRNSSDVALRIHNSLDEGFTVTICGDGSLYVENTNNPGTPGCVSAADVGNVDLIIADSVDVTFHVEGRNQWDDGNDAAMHGLQGSNSSTLRICDSATLTMEVPEILNDETDDFNGRYRGLANFVDVIVEDQATVNLDLLELYYDGDTGVHQQFHQRGGNVNINARPSILVDEETGESYYWYDPLNINDGSLLDISGGNLNIDVDHRNAAPADCTMINVDKATMQVSGGQVILWSNVPGTGIYVDGNEGELSRLYYTGGTLTHYNGGEDATFLNIAYYGRATFAGGTIRTDGGRIGFEGYDEETAAVKWIGTNMEAWNSTIDVEGNFKMSGGLIQLNDSRFHANNTAEFTGGTLDMNDSVMVVNGTAKVEGGATLDFDMTKPVEDGTALEMNNTMTIGGNGRIDIDIALENTQDENGEYIHFAGIHNFGNIDQNGGTVNINSNAGFTDDIVSWGNLTLNSGEMNLTGISGIQMDKNPEWENAGTFILNEGMTLNVDTTRNGINLFGMSWFNGGSVNINVEGTDVAYGIYVMGDGFLDVYDGIHSVKVVTTEETDGIGIVADGAKVSLMGGSFTVDAEQAMTCWAIEEDAATIGFADLVDVETGVQIPGDSWSVWVDDNGKNNFDLILPGEDAGPAKHVRMGGEPVTLQSVLPNLEVSGGRYYLAQAVVVEESMDLAIDGQPVILDVIRGGKITVRNGAALVIPEGAHLVAHDNEEDNDLADGTIIVEAGSRLINNGLIANDGGVVNVQGTYSASGNSVAVSHYANGAFTFLQGVDASYQEINANIADADQLKEIVNEIWDTTQDGEKIRYRYAYIWTPNSMSLDGVTIPENTELAIDGQEATAILTVSEDAICTVSGKLSLGNAELTVNGKLNNFGEIHTDIHDNAKITVNGTFFVSDAGRTYLNQADMTINGEYTHWQESCGLDINDGSVVTVAADGRMEIRGGLNVGCWKNTPGIENVAGTLDIYGQVDIYGYLGVDFFGEETGGVVNVKDGGNLTICCDPSSDIYAMLEMNGEMNVEAGGTLDLENNAVINGTLNVAGSMSNRGEIDLYGALNVSGNLYNQVETDSYYGVLTLFDAEDGTGATLTASAGAYIENYGSIRNSSHNGMMDVEQANFVCEGSEMEVCMDWFDDGTMAKYKGIPNDHIFLVYEGDNASVAINMANHSKDNGYRDSIVRVVGHMEVGAAQSLDCGYLIILPEGELEVNGSVNAHVRLMVRQGAKLTVGTNGWIISDNEMRAFAGDDYFGNAVVENRGTLECGPNGTMGFYGDYNDFGVGTIYNILADGSMGQIEGVGTDRQTLFTSVVGENGEQQLRDLIDRANPYGYAILNVLTEISVTDDLYIPENVRVRITEEGENIGSMTLYNEAYVDNRGTIVANRPYAALLTDSGSYGGDGVYYGYCGTGDEIQRETVLWTLRDGIMTISGEGAIADYAFDAAAPWLNLKIDKVVLDSGITRIGDFAFQKCYATMVIPKSLQHFGTYCFSGTRLKVYCGSAAADYLESIGYDADLITQFHDPDENGVCACGYGLADVLDDPLTSAQDKAEELKNFDTDSLKDAMEDQTLADQLAGLEEELQTDVVIRVEDGTSDTVKDAFENVEDDASILGAVLNAEEDVSEVHLVLGDPEGTNSEAKLDGFNSEASVLFSMTLEGVGNDAHLDIPVKITLPLPGNITDLNRLVVMHYHDGSQEGQRVNYTLFTNAEGKAMISFVINGFSDFLVGEEKISANLRATVKPNTVTTDADPENIQISLSYFKGLSTSYIIEDAEGNEVDLADAVKIPGTYYVVPTYVANSRFDVTVQPATLTVQEAEYVCVNTTTNEKFQSVSAALAAANSGETVQLTRDYTEKNEIILKSGVTLDVGKYTLTAEKDMIGLDGSYLDGDPFDIDGSYGKVVTRKSFTMLSDGAYVDEKNYSILPIYYNDGYVFTRMEVNTDQKKEPNRGLSVDTENKQIRFQFVTNMTGDVRKNILNDGATGNCANVVVRLEWEVIGGDDIAYQDFVYNDAQIAAICSGGKDFTFTMVGYDALNIDLDTLSVKGIVKTDCGVIEYGSPWNVQGS